MISELPLEVPGVVIGDAAVHDLENSNMLLRSQKIRNSLLHGKHHESNEHFALQMDSNLLKLFHSALKADRLVRAWDIAKVLGSEKALQGKQLVCVWKIRVCKKAQDTSLGLL